MPQLPVLNGKMEHCFIWSVLLRQLHLPGPRMALPWDDKSLLTSDKYASSEDDERLG